MPARSPLAPFASGTSRRVRFDVTARPERELPVVDALLAGASVVDITPPPGMPKAGYSANAHTGTGFRTRLRARVLHLRSGTSSIALVQCDLLGGSAILQRLVSDAIAAETDVGLSGLFIGATHTHAGPGQYLGTDFYNRFASNHPGFDPAFAHFLVDRISTGVIEACASRVPARVAVGSTEVWGLTRNRSLDAHVRNPTVADPSLEPHRKFHAVNPLLHLIRADALVGDPLAAMVVFSVHGTGVPMRASEYNADLWAYLCGELRWRIRDSTDAEVVVGAMEGTHADVAPAIRPGAAGHLEAARVGRAIGAEAHRLYDELEEQLTDRVELGAGLREVDLDRNPSIDGVTLPRRPAVGAALIAGARENVTPVIHRIPPFAPGHPKAHDDDDPQGGKWIIGSRWLQPVVLPLQQFPRVLPVQVLRIGEVVVAGLPFEVTVAAGEQIISAMRAAVDADSPRQFLVSSVANEYSGYVTTAAEYEQQNYEGAHTLYGANTAAFLAAHAARLAREVVADGSVLDVVPTRRFDLRARRHLARPSARRVERRFTGIPRYLDPRALLDGCWLAEWLDVAPGDLEWHEPLVRVETTTSAVTDDDDQAEWRPAARERRPIDDQGWDLQVTHLGPADDGHRYAVRWWDPVFDGGRRFRFVLVPNADQPEVRSPSFG